MKEGGEIVVKKLLEIFGKHDIDFWLSAGTLLGCVRDGCFIPWDDDIDVALRYEDWNEKALKDLKENKFEVKWYATFNHKTLRYVGPHKRNALSHLRLIHEGIPICVQPFHVGIGQYNKMIYCWNGLPKSNWLFETPIEYQIPQIKTKFYDMEVLIPKNHMEYLEFLYGNNWRTPLRNYKWGKEHKENMKKFRRNIMEAVQLKML